MRSLRGLAAALAALVLPALAAGCGVGAGEADEGEAELRVTREYGSDALLEATVDDPPESETVMRFLDREAEITTRFGGGFVQSIEGLSGGTEGGRAVDWFFFVNGIESSVGAAEVPVRAGDRIWWDHRDWTDAMRVPAVVGSYPEPLAQTAERPRHQPVRVECAAEREACDEVAERLAADGVDLDVERFPGPGGPDDAIRVLVGDWGTLRDDREAAVIEDGPSASGVFATFERSGRRWELVALDADGTETETMPAGGLVAAVAPEGEPPTWLVTGATPEGIGAAVSSVGEAELRDRYALAVSDDEEVALPMEGPP